MIPMNIFDSRARKRKRPEHRPKEPHHHGEHGTRAHHKDIHPHKEHFSTFSHQTPQVPTAARARRQATSAVDVGTSGDVSVQTANINIDTSADPSSAVRMAIETQVVGAPPPNNAVVTVTRPGQTLTTTAAAAPTSDSAVPVQTTVPAVGSATAAGAATAAATTQSVTVVPLSLSSDSPLASALGSAANDQSSVAAQSTASSSSNSTSSLTPTTATTMHTTTRTSSRTSSNMTTSRSSHLSSTQHPTITSSGILLVPFLTTPVRIAIPITNSDGSTISTSYATSLETLYSTMGTIASAAPNTESAASPTTSSGKGSGSAAAAGLNGANGNNSNGSDSGPDVPTPTVVGGVVGGVAGLAVVLLLVLLLLRWYRRRRENRSLEGLDDDDYSTRRPGTSTTAGTAAAGASAAGGVGLLKRMSRRVGPPPAEAPPQMTQTGGSFQRIGGRKLPSQFSPGIEGPGPTAAYPSGASSNYPSGGTFASSAATPDNPFDDPVSAGTSPTTAAFASAAGAGGLSGIVGARHEPASQAEKEMIMPGPGRTPTLHQGASNRASSQLLMGTPQEVAEHATSAPLTTPSRTSQAGMVHPALRSSTIAPGTAVTTDEPEPSEHTNAAMDRPLQALYPGRSLSPTHALRGRGRGSYAGSAAPRGNSGSRFVEEDL